MFQKDSEFSYNIPEIPRMFEKFQNVLEISTSNQEIK